MPNPSWSLPNSGLRYPLCSARSAGPLHPAGGGDGGHGAGDQHERDRGAGRGAEPHGEVRGQSGAARIKGQYFTGFFSSSAAAGVTAKSGGPARFR